MKFKKKKGAALYQYIIIIALIALVLVPVLMALGNITNQTFESYLSFYSTMSKNAEKNAPITKTGSLGGTSTSPVSQCNAGTCNIDFGDFVLNGIPENFGDFVQTAGTSGGDNMLADLLTQIAESRKISDPEGYEDYMKLANLVHIQADTIRYVEDKIKASATTTELGNIFNAANMGQVGYNIPPELADTFPNFDQTFSLPNTIVDMAWIRKKKVNNEDVSQYYTTNIIDQYDKIMADPKYSENLKALTQEIYLNLADLSGGADNVINNANACNWVSVCSATQNKLDPITGAIIGTETVPASPDLNAVLHPELSLKNDINGALVCTAGKNIDTSTSCHQ